MISVIIPTIRGREESFARCVRSYEATSPPDTEYVVIEDRPEYQQGISPETTYVSKHLEVPMGLYDDCEDDLGVLGRGEPAQGR